LSFVLSPVRSIRGETRLENFLLAERSAIWRDCQQLGLVVETAKGRGQRAPLGHKGKVGWTRSGSFFYPSFPLLASPDLPQSGSR